MVSRMSRRANQINVRVVGSADPSQRMLVDAIVTTPGYVRAAGLTLLGGREFSDRTREIVIRLALGAQTSTMRWMILRRGAALAGLAIGLVGAYASRWILETQLYGVSPTDVATLWGVAALLLAVALAACYLPARRAMSVDPVRALRAD